ncbi:hypothetical protein ACFQGT_13650 [Natrialbaceae archaeon GCM10025810]|uniref:DUF7553 family protein n=1 Tax=Halovalidus salilacus TaxID=3075124 RepID=UPI00361661F0
MSQEALEDAAQSLREAAEAADDEENRERLENQSETLAGFAEDDSGVDHGRLARHEHIIGSIAEDEGGDVADRADDALESIHAYRETLEGV